MKMKSRILFKNAKYQSEFFDDLPSRGFKTLAGVESLLSSSKICSLLGSSEA